MHIELKNIHLSFDEHVVLDDVSITIPEGKITTIMGPSGSGKTILMRLIGGQIEPQAGQVWVDGKNLSKLKTSELYQLRMRMGAMFQTSALFPDITVFENVAFPLREHTDLSENLIKNIVYMKLHAVGLRGARDLLPSELSGGMQRRVALARAVVFDPGVILYDDPFSGLDPISIATILRLMRTLNENLEITSVIVSHDVDEILSITDYIHVIADGRVVATGSPSEMKQSQNEWVKQFLSANADGPVSFNLPAEEISKELLL